MADHGTNKTGFVRDDELKREMQDELNSKPGLRTDESYAPEPSGENQPVTERLPADQEGGTPPGMTPQDVFVRSELARHLERGIFPARRNGLLEALQRHQAPDAVVDLVRALPADEAFANVQEVMRASGRGVEVRRV